MKLSELPQEASCGVLVKDIDLTTALDSTHISALRAAWLEHHVLVFPDQVLSIQALEQFSGYFGDFGDDPFIQSIDQSDNVIAVQRKADETASIFADVWHTDWSFQAIPPAGTCLYGVTIPPRGGNTDFINQHKALQSLPAELRTEIEGKQAIHSAVLGYSPQGIYGSTDNASDRSMKIISSESAYEQQCHPLIRVHPESKKEALYGCMGYIIGIEGLPEEKSTPILQALYDWQLRPEFQYSHHWQANMLVMWDNRSVLHKANGGYDGYDRLLYRTTIADTRF